MHPVEHDLRGPPVSCGHIACHDLSCGSTETKIKNLDLAILTHSDVTRFQILENDRMEIWQNEVMGMGPTAYPVYDSCRMDILQREREGREGEGVK